MTDKQIKKYCDGLDCSWCNEKEPCIYKIANELEEKLLTKEQECKAIVKVAKTHLAETFEMQKEIDQLKAEVKSKTEYIQEQRDIINQYSKEIEMYKKCQGKRASKREEELKAENETKQKALELQKSWIDNLEFQRTNLKQALSEIKEIADGMHDLWINKTPYTDIDNLVKHLLECELNRIRYKIDDISEVE